MDDTSMSDKPIPAQTLSKKFPAIKELITESWTLLTKKTLKLLFLGLLSIVVNAVLFILAMVAVLGVGVMKISSFSNPDAVLEALMSPALIGTAISVGILLFAGIMVVGAAMQAAMLILLKDPKEETSVIDYFKQGFSYVVPLLIVSFITFVIVFGSLFVFIIPAMIIGIFLMFTMYTVIVDNKKGMDAIKMSVGIVSQNFGAVIGRVTILWLLSFAVQMLIGMLPNDEPSAVIFYLLISFVASFAIGWFGLTYSFKLYEHAKAAYDGQKPTSMTWMWIISVIGWVIGALFLTGILSAVRNENFQKTIKDAVEKEMKDGSMQKFDMDTSDTDFDIEGPLDSQILTLINVARFKAGLVPLTQEQQLCAYAARRLKQLDDFGGFDDYAGFYEDIGEQSTWSTFFRGYENVTNVVRERIESNNEAAGLVSALTKNTNEDSAVLSEKFTDICIRCWGVSSVICAFFGSCSSVA